MARFRNNHRQVVAGLVYQQAGLRVERVQRFDQTTLLPEVDHWRSWSFRITLGGTRYISYDDRVYTLAPNTVFWHSPLREAVRTRGLPGTGSDVVVVTSTTSWWGGFLEQHAAFRERNAALLGSCPDRPLLALQLAPPQLLHVLRQFIALRQRSGTSVVALENYCTLLLHLIGDLRFDMAIKSPTDECRQRVEQAQGRMVARLACPPSIQQIAADLNVSPRQLQRDFLSVTGLTPIRYFNVVRLSEANNLLAETTLPIAEIARLLGYVSMAHFSAAFRQAYDCSPRQVRAQNEELRIEDCE